MTSNPDFVLKYWLCPQILSLTLNLRFELKSLLGLSRKNLNESGCSCLRLFVCKTDWVWLGLACVVSWESGSFKSLSCLSLFLCVWNSPCDCMWLVAGLCGPSNLRLDPHCDRWSVWMVPQRFAKVLTAPLEMTIQPLWTLANCLQCCASYSSCSRSSRSVQLFYACLFSWFIVWMFYTNNVNQIQKTSSRPNYGTDWQGSWEHKKNATMSLTFDMPKTVVPRHASS